MKLIDFKSLGPAKGINYSRDHLRRKCKAGEFPQPIPVSALRIAWIEAEVDEWLADRARALNRDGSGPGEALSPIAATDFVGEVVGSPDPPEYFCKPTLLTRRRLILLLGIEWLTARAAERDTLRNPKFSIMIC